MTIRTALEQGAGLFERDGVPVPRLTAEVLLGYALHQERAYLYAHPEQELKQVEWLHYGRYLHERLLGKPTQYITKQQEFYGRAFRVTNDVLIPRPETEHVIEAVLKFAPGVRRVVDVGCGSGAIAVTLALETKACVFGTDISQAALAVAKHNAGANASAVHFVCCDLMKGLAAHSIDAVVSNPPYVPLAERESMQREVRDWEPHVALFSGPTGFEIYERLIADARRVLRAGGWLVLELGFGSRERVLALLGNGWSEPQIVDDLAGIPRVVACQMAAHGTRVS